MIDGRANHLGTGRQVGILLGVELELIDLPFAERPRVARVHGAEAGLKSGRAFVISDDPLFDVEPFHPVRTARDVRDRHRALANAVGEPARVGHLVERVDVDGTDLLQVARLTELVDEEIKPFAELARPGAAGVEGRVVVGR